jgi:hypothetical protein
MGLETTLVEIEVASRSEEEEAEVAIAANDVLLLSTGETSTGGVFS